MDCYISENSDLKKKLEELASQNKSLLDQLKTLKATLENQPATPNVNNSIILPGEITSTNSNQFGTLLMVLILFFAVVLGVWSPVFTKDQMTRHLSATSTMTNTASVAVAATNVASSNISQRIQTNSISSSAAAVTAVCAAASAIASTFNLKTESVSPTHSPDDISNTHQDEMPPSLVFHQSQFGNKDLESPLIPFEGELVKLFPKAENGEQSAIETNSHLINNVLVISACFIMHNIPSINKFKSTFPNELSDLFFDRKTLKFPPLFKEINFGLRKLPLWVIYQSLCNSS
jgi:hypothetical protein